MKRNIIIAAALLSSVMTFGAGFQLNLQGLRQLAMAGGGTALAWDASTIFYNPGALADMSGVQAYGSILAIVPNAEYAQAGPGNYTAHTVSQTFTPFNIYVGGPVGKNSRIAVGLGIYTPFGSGSKWDDNWAGRYLIQSIKLQSFFIQPTVSYKLTDVVSIGAGFVYAFGNLSYREALPLQDAKSQQDGEASLQGRASGIGCNLGIHVKASDKIQLGFTYRSEVDMKVTNGTADFTVPSSLTSSFPNTTFKSQLPLPQVLSFGVGYKATPKLTLQLDINYVGWGSYDSLKFDFAQHTSQLQDNHAPRHYKNTVAYRLGANYAFSNKFSGMAGCAWDPTPVANGFVSPELPDANRVVLTAGFSYMPVKKLAILAAVEYTTTAKRNSTYDYGNFNGTYQTKAITPGIGLTYDF